jgi:hypothetical protein
MCAYNRPRAAPYTRASRIKVNRCARTVTRLNWGNAGFDLDEARDLMLRSVRFWDRLVSKPERRYVMSAGHKSAHRLNSGAAVALQARI